MKYLLTNNTKSYLLVRIHRVDNGVSIITVKNPDENNNNSLIRFFATSGRLC